MPRFKSKNQCIEYYTSKGFNKAWIERICEVVTYASKKRVSKEELGMIRDQVVAELQATNSYSTTYTLGNGIVVDVMVVAIPTKVIIKETASGNYKIGALDPNTNEWISLFFDNRDDAEYIADSFAGDIIIVVGKKKEREMPDGRVLSSVNVWGYIPLDEQAATEQNTEQGEQPVEEQQAGVEPEAEEDNTVDVDIPEDLPAPENV
ncbi:MAG: hypothetical protein GXO43_05880 [Crenarchaeota archaeon]|nr:hypothetical protein [Thermoproteota archaeon]